LIPSKPTASPGDHIFMAFSINQFIVGSLENLRFLTGVCV